MASITLSLNSADTQRAIARLRARAVPAIVRALNRAQTSANAVMVRLVAADLGLKQKDIRDGIRLKPATASKLSAEIVATGARIPLVKFSARDRRPRGVSARIPGGAGRYPQAFIATMRSGHTGVFQRKGVARLPIRELHGPSMPKVFEKHIPEGLARGEESLVKNLIHELRFATRQAAA